MPQSAWCILGWCSPSWPADLAQATLACHCPVGQPTACWCTVCLVPPLASQMPAGAQFCSVGQPNVCWCTNCPDCGATSLSTHQSGPLDLHCPEISLFPRSLHMEGTYLLRRKFWIFGRKLGRCYILPHLIRATSSLPVCEHMVLLVPQS